MQGRAGWGIIYSMASKVTIAIAYPNFICATDTGITTTFRVGSANSNAKRIKGWLLSAGATATTAVVMDGDFYPTLDAFLADLGDIR
jgi:hypothetical protein